MKHPLSSTESAALTQLRSELKSLLAKSSNTPDLSLGPLPKPSPQGPLPPAVLATKVARPKPLLRQTSSFLRRSHRRRATADAALPSRPARQAVPSALQPLQAGAKVAKAAKQKAQSSGRAVSNSPQAVSNRGAVNEQGAVSNSAKAVSDGPEVLCQSQRASSSSLGAAASQAGADHDSYYGEPTIHNVAATAASTTALDVNCSPSPAVDIAVTSNLHCMLSRDQLTVEADTAKQLSHCMSWPMTSGIHREGVTQDTVATTSYSFRCVMTPFRPQD